MGLNSQQSEYGLFRVIDCVYENVIQMNSKNTQNTCSVLLHLNQTKFRLLPGEALRCVTVTCLSARGWKRRAQVWVGSLCAFLCPLKTTAR